jgi:hypothetical protein
MAPKVKRTLRKGRVKKSHSRLHPFDKGVVWGLHLADVPRLRIQQLTCKTDGSAPSLRAIDAVIARKKAEDDWKGEKEDVGGRPAALSAPQKKQVVKLVFKERGSRRLTVPFCMKRLRFLRKFCQSTVFRALADAGLSFLTRRQKAFVPRLHKVLRLAYCESIMRKHQKTLQRYAYTDGTTFYLARSVAERVGKDRLALGKMVWRMSSGKDGLWDDCVGPSLYAKAQGLPVKIWGFFANGRLEYWVLPADAENPKKTLHMNGDRFNWLVENKFALWRKRCFRGGGPVFLIMDHERCLWQERNLTALSSAGLTVVENFPKSSPDLNAIEGWWKVLRGRLADMEPTQFEDRTAFVSRLRRTVAWHNLERCEHAKELCCNQKTRAEEVMSLKGAKCKW